MKIYIINVIQSKVGSLCVTEWNNQVQHCGTKGRGISEFFTLFFLPTLMLTANEKHSKNVFGVD